MEYISENGVTRVIEEEEKEENNDTRAWEESSHTGYGENSSITSKPRDRKTPLGDSGQNSLEYWDYTIELEMMKDGVSDLQLAAELGKTLLERNKNLESTIKDQRVTIDDKVDQIEYLKKQISALREVNDSRFRIYEQLEVSVQELEKQNQRLIAESYVDKKKIKNLISTTDQLETKCEELEKALEEAKSLQRRKEPSEEEEEQEERRRSLTKKILSGDDSSFKRSLSCGNNAKYCQSLANEFVELEIKMEDMEAKLRYLEDERQLEIKKRDELEVEMKVVVQENYALKEQLLVLKDRDTNVKSIEDEVASLDDTSSSKVCKKCMGIADETGSNMTVQDFGDDLEEETDVSYDDIQGDCALVKLKNGGYAWGSQESLASMGQIVNCVDSSSSSPRTEGSEAPNSLLAELDAQYRILIAKYEALLEAREQQHQHQQQQQNQLKGGAIVDSGIDEVSGPMSIVMTKLDSGEQSLCQRCTTCTCDMKIPSQETKRTYEERLEVETSSSGFSEGEPRTCFVSTQTDSIHSCCCKEPHDLSTPTATQEIKYLDLHTPLNPCEKRFQSTPVYQKIFHEIFEVLKKDIARENVSVAVTRTLMMRAGCCKLAACNSKVSEEHSDKISNEENKNPQHINGNETTKIDELVTDRSEADKSILNTECEKSSGNGVSLVEGQKDLKDENEENKNPNVILSEEKKDTSKVLDITKETTNDEGKPNRPDFLDLDSSSRGSSRSRRKKRHNRRNNSCSKTTKDSSETAINDAKSSSSLSITDEQQPNIERQQSMRRSRRNKYNQDTSDAKKNETKNSSASNEVQENLKSERSESADQRNSPPNEPSSERDANDQKREMKKSDLNLEKLTSQKDELTNSTKGHRTKCEHKKKKSKRQHKGQQQQLFLQNKHLANVLGPNSLRAGQSQLNPAVRPLPQMLPSVHVAKLIKFEKTYAEVLKS